VKDLELVILVDEGGYNWSAVGVFRAKDGRLYWGADSGCSCSSPFDGRTSVDLEPLTRDNMQEAIDEVRRVTDSVGEVTSFIEELEALLKGAAK
jgi:hypothetical protein